MRCNGGGSNRARRDSVGRWRKWEEFARPAKPAGLAKEGKDVGSMTNSTPLARSVASTRITRGGESIQPRTASMARRQVTRRWVGAALPPEAAQNSPEDEPQQRRHPQPEAGRRMATAMAARKRRRINMELLPISEQSVVGSSPRRHSPARSRRSARVPSERTTVGSPCGLHPRDLRETREDFSRRRAVVTISPNGRISEVREGVPVMRIATP